MEIQHILMGDVVNSRQLKGKILSEELGVIIKNTNRQFKKNILSPLTITLGDEFQGITDSPETAIKIIISIEEQILLNNFSFKLRYAFHSGLIDTTINNKFAHGMLGKGLIFTRELLNNAKKNSERFLFNFNNKSCFLNKLFILYGAFVDGWKIKDYKIISQFISEYDYKKIAQINHTTNSAMWKKRQSLQIKEYNTIKELIFQYATGI